MTAGPSGRRAISSKLPRSWRLVLSGVSERLAFDNRTYLLKEELTLLWDQQTPEAADTFLKDWTFRAMRSNLEPIKKIARMLRRHQPLILNWFLAGGTISAGIVEGKNNKLKVITRSSYGFRTFKVTRVALYHKLGHLPEPKFAHTFF